MTPRLTRCLLLLLLLAPALSAATNTPAAGWKTAYTLGPGDILNIGLYGRSELDRNQVFIQPDGTLTYLQAQNIRATGLTLEQLRTQLETELSRYYKKPRIILSPFELRSKKYYLLGKVVDNGAFPMDRPITLLEAVARARGIETGLFEQNTVELADLERAFLIRNGKRLPLDFEKLFLQGDLSQNVEIEPGDYIYFPSANSAEVYVLGEVVQPGVQGFTSKLTALGAIARREGFSRKAWRERVLVVRGSLGQPELHVVNTDAILQGRAPDFLLKPKDIIFVASHPWQDAADLADAAVNAFLQSAVTAWTGVNVPGLIKSPILPQLQSTPAQPTSSTTSPETP